MFAGPSAWSEVIGCLRPLRRVHVQNAREVVLVSIPAVRPRARCTEQACACCGHVAELRQLVDVAGDRVCGVCRAG